MANLDVLQRAYEQDLSNEFIQSGIIDKFAMQFELAWKLLRSALDYEGCLEAATGSPRGVIAFGCARIVDDPAEKLRSLEMLGRKYNPESAEESLQAEIAHGIDRLVMVAILIDRLTGKEVIELTRQGRTEDRS